MDRCGTRASHNLPGGLNCTPSTLNMFRRIRLSQASVGPEASQGPYATTTERRLWSQREPALICEPSIRQSLTVSATQLSKQPLVVTFTSRLGLARPVHATLSAGLRATAGQGTRTAAERVRTVTQPGTETTPSPQGREAGRCFLALLSLLLSRQVSLPIRPSEYF